jgi:hypothetical protein
MPLLALLLLLVLPNAMGAVVVPQAVHGSAHVTRMNNFLGGGPSWYVQDGAHDHHFACTDCFLNLTIDGPGLRMVQQGEVVDLGPGVWQIREFTGSFAYDRNGPGDFQVHLEGKGRPMRVA